MQLLHPVTGLVTALLLLSSCAAHYQSIYPDSLQYSAKSVNDGVELGYRYAVLEDKGNKKYAKKESKSGIKLVALSIANHTDHALTLGKNMRLASGDFEAPVVEPDIVVRKLRQNAPAYLWYLLLSFAYAYEDNGYERKVYRVGLVIGPGLAIANLAVANSANNKFKQEIMRNNLLNRTIKPGETATGLIGIRNSGYNPLSIKLTQ